jgi:hypothetical protein
MPPVIPPRTERLALNAADLADAGADDLVRRVVGGRVDPNGMVWVDRARRDGSVLPMTCRLLAAAMACDILRSEDRRVGRRVTRVYLSRDGRPWVELSETAVLTVADDSGKCRLNPVVFPPPTLFLRSAPTPKRLRGE